METNPPRLFDVAYETPTGLAYEQVTAAYWTMHENAVNKEISPLVFFKDANGKPVFAVSLGAVISIREIRDRPVVQLDWEELRIASVILTEAGYMEDAAPDSDTAALRRKAGELGRKLQAADRVITVNEDPLAEIVKKVQDGLLSIDEARAELGKLPWNTPETQDRRPWDSK